MPKRSKRILVIRLSAMGDVAMTVPVLRAFVKQYPDIKITVLTRKSFKPLFRDIENVAVFEADLKGAHKGLFGLVKLAIQLRKNHRFYAIADLHNVLRSKVLKIFLKCKKLATIDKGRNEKKELISGASFKPLKSTHERYADVFKDLGYPIDLSNPQFPKPAILSQKAQDRIGLSSKKMIGIAPFAAHKGKMYPLDLMKQVIAELSKDYKIILFGGGKHEIKKLREFEKDIENTINLAGKLSLEDQLDVISNLDVMVSMDSGNAHLAAMLGLKVVTIWGVTHPFAGFSPFNQPMDYALVSNRNQFPQIPTSVYGNKYPKGYEEVSRSITPEEVINKVKSIV